MLKLLKYFFPSNLSSKKGRIEGGAERQKKSLSGPCIYYIDSAKV
jgi:hypothetical protein